MYFPKSYISLFEYNFIWSVEDFKIDGGVRNEILQSNRSFLTQPGNRKYKYKYIKIG